MVAGGSGLNRVANRATTEDEEEYFEPSILSIRIDPELSCNLFFFLLTDPVQISELLAKTIGDAHSRTCLFSGEHIADMMRKPQDISKVVYYKNMVSRSKTIETTFSCF